MGAQIFGGILMRRDNPTDQQRSQKGKVDDEVFASEKMLLELQLKNATKWRDGCVLYFQTFSKMPIPAGLPAPEHDLKYYQENNPR